MDEECGILAGEGRAESWPHLTSVLLTQRSERGTVYRFPPAAACWAAIPSPVDRRFAYAQPPVCGILNHFDSLELFRTHRHHP